MLLKALFRIRTNLHKRRKDARPLAAMVVIVATTGIRFFLINVYVLKIIG